MAPPGAADSAGLHRRDHRARARRARGMASADADRGGCRLRLYTHSGARSRMCAGPSARSGHAGSNGGSAVKAFALLLVLIAPLAAAAVVGNDEIRRILAERIDARKQAVGIVAGVIDSAGRRGIGYGELAAGDTRTPEGDTVLEIGPVHQVFTALFPRDYVAEV